MGRASQGPGSPPGPAGLSGVDQQKTNIHPRPESGRLRSPEREDARRVPEGPARREPEPPDRRRDRVEGGALVEERERGVAGHGAVDLAVDLGPARGVALAAAPFEEV